MTRGEVWYWLTRWRKGAEKAPQSEREVEVEREVVRGPKMHARPSGGALRAICGAHLRNERRRTRTTTNFALVTCRSCRRIHEGTRREDREDPGKVSSLRNGAE